MVRFGIRLTVLACCLLVSAASVKSQVATGTPPYGSFSGGPDIVNEANLNVHLSIPVVQKAGRGLPFYYVLSYDSSVWYPVGVSGSQTWTPVTNWGWRGITEAQTGYVSYKTTQNSCCYPCGQFGTWYYWTTYWDWKYHDSLGTVHPFNVTVSTWNSSIPCGGGAPYSMTGTSTDGSGYTMTVTASPSVTSLKSRSGKTIVAPLGQPSGSGTVTDSNGNKVNTDGTDFFDTLSSTTPVLNVSGAAPVNYKYYNPAGSQVWVVVSSTTQNIKTNFGCSGVTEYTQSGVSLVYRVTLPDSTYYEFTYEPTPGFTGYVTGRVKSVRLPTGGTVTYTYTGSNNGIVCTDGSTRGLTRVVNPGGTRTYTRTLQSGSDWKTVVKSPENKETVLRFQGLYETKREVYDGLVGVGTLLATLETCYDGAAFPCQTTAITLPIDQRTILTTIPGLSQSKRDEYYDSYGLPTEVREYDYGLTLVRKTLISYNRSLTNNIVDRPASITLQNSSGGTVSQATFEYDCGNYSNPCVTAPGGTTPQHVSITGSRGNLTSVTSGGLTRSLAYYDTGNVKTMTDVNLQPTDYAYDSTGCANSLLTTVTLPITGLARSMAWDCGGAVVSSVTDENGKVTSFNYNDPTDPYYWRVQSITDAFPSTTNFSYFTLPHGSESDLDFNGTTSTVDTRTTLDDLGRAHITQRKQSQGSSTYDSVQVDYDSVGRLWRVSVPYSAAAEAPYTGASFTTTTYDPLGRPLLVTDAGGGTVSYSYTKNDVFVTVGPDPDGAGSENTKRRQFEYDALGRLTSVCEVTTASGNGSCAQSSPQTGYWTKYTYDAADRLLSVTQNAQTTPTQTRSYEYDGLGRVLKATDPESGQTTFTYDSIASGNCAGTYNGDLIKRQDAVANVTCYKYDYIHRLTEVNYPAGSYAGVTPEKHFVYDSATVNGQVMQNAKGRLAEAYTGPLGSKITDLGFSYGPTGLLENAYQKTLNSDGYYRAKAAYWENGLVKTLNLYKNDGSTLLLPTFTYAPEGEGRVDTVSASTGQNPVTDTAYGDLWGQPTGVTFGSGDTDAFTYDSSTGRMTQYKFNIGSPVQSVVGNLTWNANASLKTLGITDPFNSLNTQTCNYTYDDMARIKSANCGTIWNETFAFDVFGNIGKTGISGATDFCPSANGLPPACYDTATNHITTVGSQTFAYDSNGNLTSTGTGTGTSAYTWDAEGHMKTDSPSGLTSVTLTYDALGRMVEQARGTSYTQIVYGPQGNKLALMNGQTLTKAFVPLSGGATAVYAGMSLSYYRHADWQGSSRFASTPTTRTKYFSAAYAPYGENYAESGTTDRNFTGQNQDTTGDLYDFMFREHNYTHGRWISPDPVGGSIFNPQSFNRYAYVLNSPTNLIDPLGLDPPYCEANAQCPEPPVPPCGVSGFAANCVLDESGRPYDPGVAAMNAGCHPGSELCNAEAQYGARMQAVFDSLVLAGFVQQYGVKSDEVEAFLSTHSDVTLDFGLLASATVQRGGNIAVYELWGYYIVADPLKLAGMAASPVASPWAPVAWYGVSAGLAVGGPIAWEAAGGYPGLYVKAAYAGMGASYALNGWGWPQGTGAVGFVSWVLTWVLVD